MSNPESEKRNRLNKLDSFFLWVASLSGVGFSIFIAYLRVTFTPYIPIFVLIACAVCIGYLKGAVFSDKLTERIRGWNYLLLGLFTYMAFIFFTFSRSYIESQLPNSVLYFQTFTIIAVVVIYVIISRKMALPRIYDNFDEPYGKVTRRIMNRTMIPSFLLGAVLYIFALILSQTTFDVVLVVYSLFALLLIVPIITEEKRIGKLLPLEKYHKYVEIGKIEKNKPKNFFLVLIGATEITLLVLLQLPFESIKEFLLPTIILFGISFIGYLAGLFYADRGDIVEEGDIAAIELQPQELAKLRELIGKANC
jgi:hypothetical protein